MNELNINIQTAVQPVIDRASGLFLNILNSVSLDELKQWELNENDPHEFAWYIEYLGEPGFIEGLVDKTLELLTYDCSAIEELKQPLKTAFKKNYALAFYVLDRLLRSTSINLPIDQAVLHNYRATQAEPILQRLKNLMVAIW